MMERTQVDNSSTIAAVGYDPQTGMLEVTFKSGGTYRYADVPAAAHAALMQADSIGKHFHAHIRGKFDHARLPEQETDNG